MDQALKTNHNQSEQFGTYNSDRTQNNSGQYIPQNAYDNSQNQYRNGQYRINNLQNRIEPMEIGTIEQEENFVDNEPLIRL